MYYTFTLTGITVTFTGLYIIGPIDSWRKMEQPYSPNLSDSAECVILCTSWLQSPGRFPGEGGHLSEQGSVIRGLTILHKSF